jgi:hypothetical protein
MKFWDESVYIGVHKFHAVKGLDPDSLDIARGLGYSLYELYVPALDQKTLRINFSHSF